MKIRVLLIFLSALSLAHCITSYRSTLDFVVEADSTARTRVIDAATTISARYGLNPDTSASVPPVIFGYTGNSDHYYVLMLRDSSDGRFLSISLQHFAFVSSISTRTFEAEEAFADTLRAIFGPRILQSKTVRTPSPESP